MIDKNKIYVTLGLAAAMICGFFAAVLAQPVDFTQYNDNLKSTYRQSAKIVIDSNCPIKAKLGKSKGGPTKIYHLPGSLGYSRIKATECFTNEQAAKASGYIRSKN